MIRIRTKLLAYVMLLVLLLSGIAFFLYQSSLKSLDQYDQMLQRFFLLNEIFQKTNHVYQFLNAYLLDKSPEILEQYAEERRHLVALQLRLSEIEDGKNYLMVDNYRNMISSFLAECDLVLDGFARQSIDAYSNHAAEAWKISRFIQETTLMLLNSELSTYQQFYANISKKNAYFQSMGISLFASTVLLSTLFALWFSRGITRPIRELSLAAREISRGHFDGADVPATTKDELRLLTEAFNQMRANIRRLIGEIRQKSELARLLKEMELKSLQSQINPHFLFNTLNTVAKLAYVEGAERTSELIASISALLRYNLRKIDRETTLAEEVRVVKEYFFIQKARFGDRVAFYTEIDESCLSAVLPPLTLQPVVENAFIHGIEPHEGEAWIRLKVYPHGDCVVVEVSDNGAGMDEATRAKLLKSGVELGEGGQGAENRKGHSTGLGLRNVIQRLQLFFQREEVIEIESEPGRGTTVRLILPAGAREIPELREGWDVQPADRR